MGYSKNVLKRSEYLWEINDNNPSNTITGTIPVFSIPANTIIKSVGALVQTITTEYAAAELSAVTNATNLFTKATAHGFKTGVVGQFTTTDTLPTGISASTDYYVIVMSATTFKVAATAAGAEAGTVNAITDDGSGTLTFTPTAFTVEVGDGDDTDGYLVDGFTDNAGYYPTYDPSSYSGDYCLADTGFAIDKYYADADTIDFTITGQAKSGKVRFFIEFVELI